MIEQQDIDLGLMHRSDFRAPPDAAKMTIVTSDIDLAIKLRDNMQKSSPDRYSLFDRRWHVQFIRSSLARGRVLVISIDLVEIPE